MGTKKPIEAEYVTFPQVARRLGRSARWWRRKGAEGCFPAYSGDGSRPLVKLSEAEGWLRSTRVPISNHARARVEEILDREAAAT